jgi:protein-tyrosine phosphatase
MIIDMHCHIIPNIDDGASNINTSIEMCRIAEQEGIHGIIATPHYIHGVIDNGRDIVYSKVMELNNILRERNINVDIYPGCEVFICPELPELVLEDKVCTLNNSQYVLIELPLESIPEYTTDVIYQLKLAGYTPIIAHPERNAIINNHPDTLFKLIRIGALSQLNATSLVGLFGKDIMRVSTMLLKNKMVHLLASDAHTVGGRSPRLSVAIDKIEKLAGSEALLRIMKNGEAILNNQLISVEDSIQIGEKEKIRFLSNFKRIFSGM